MRRYLISTHACTQIHSAVAITCLSKRRSFAFVALKLMTRMGSPSANMKRLSARSLHISARTHRAGWTLVDCTGPRQKPTTGLGQEKGVRQQTNSAGAYALEHRPNKKTHRLISLMNTFVPCTMECKRTSITNAYVHAAHYVHECVVLVLPTKAPDMSRIDVLTARNILD